ncbi:MAG TPA: 3D-(3,5/4)-trihydroxycyclohexane-1,2-dione acylhydrolase (decyclizing) [Burkholderiaceae bacterium]|nr:3D-(3,5/4)-trihydroxycyclohexane-1,2-dione acylhydrolase (decyclizing) [Burkholderiaceae bacterium]
MSTRRLTMAQALVAHLAALRLEHEDGSLVPWCAGVWSIFGHGNVAGLGEALWQQRSALPTFRAHNEQAMAHAAIAFAKANFRQRVMAVTTSIGPGATNLLTAAALAHVNRLPVLLLPGDVFASRTPDPVLQQVEDFGAGDVSANDAFRPLVRYFDRLTRPEQVLNALPRAVQVLTDPAACGPVCLALPQDVQTMAFDCPEAFLQPAPLRLRRAAPDVRELAAAAALLRASRRPFVVVGGGVLYSEAGAALAAFCEAHGVPMGETQAGKGSVAWHHPLNAGAIGVTGSPAANALAAEADLVIAIGTRLQDFTTGSHALFARARLLSVNVQPFDAAKWGGAAVVGDARTVLDALAPPLRDWRADAAWTTDARARVAAWNARVEALTTVEPQGELPYDAEVIGAVRDSAERPSDAHDIVVCAAGTLPAELHKLWRSAHPGGYHMEYGYSCMGYEIAGALGVKMARPECEVIAMVGDGSYLMLNSEIATSVMLGLKIIVVVLDNRGFGCIQRLQLASGGTRFNNLLEDCVAEGGHDVRIDFAAHAASLGADAVHVRSVAELSAAMRRARAAARTQVIVIDTSPMRTTADGGCWWEVAIPEASERSAVQSARAAYVAAKNQQRP